MKRWPPVGFHDAIFIQATYWRKEESLPEMDGLTTISRFCLTVILAKNSSIGPIRCLVFVT